MQHEQHFGQELLLKVSDKLVPGLLINDHVVVLDFVRHVLDRG